MGHRDFDKEIERERGSAERDPIYFTLFGTRWDCRDDVNGKLLLDRAADMDSDSMEAQRDGVVGVFEMCVLDDQIEALLNELDDPAKPIQLAKLVEIVGWLVEEYTETDPTPQPSPSPRGQSTTGRTSGARRPAKAATSRRSPRASTST